MSDTAYAADPVEEPADPAAPGDAPSDPAKTPGMSFTALKREFHKDKDHWMKWWEEAKEDFAFTANDQWSEEDRRLLKDKLRPVITFNRIDPLVRSVTGEQINSGQEVRYIPREMGDVQANEALTSAADWFRDQCEAQDEESDAFWDMVVGGVGCCDCRLDMEDDPEEPKPIVERIEPPEAFPDRNARKRNFDDKCRVWRVREMPLKDAKEMFPDAAASDLDASWARLDDNEGKPVDREESKEYRSDEDAKRGDDDTMVTIVQCQYYVKEAYYKVAIPEQLGAALEDPRIEGGVARLKVEEYEALAPKLAALLGKPPPAVRLRRRVYKQCFLGRIILKEGDAPCPEKFSFNFLTGFRDRNKGHFYGLVRGMKDPQRWANKWLSQVMHILNSTAKGGVMAEKDAAEDQRRFEESWAKQDAVTWVENGAIVEQRIREKPGSQFPQGFLTLMEFAVSSVRDVSGINLEMIGMREGDQPASLEFQRRQAGITILAILFSALRRYRRAQGAVMLYYIQRYLPGEMLVKIIGSDGKEGYVPLEAVRAAKSASIKYDIIVDEGPTSPNQKERVWGFIGPRFFELPPPMMKVFLKYSPFPASVVAEIGEAMDAAGEGPEAELQQKMMQVAAMLEEAKVMLTQAQAKKAEADAQESLADAALKGSQVGQPVGRDGVPDKGPETMLRAAELQQKGQIEQGKLAVKAQTEREKIASAERIAEANRQGAMERELAGKAFDVVTRPEPEEQGPDKNVF